MNLSIFTFQAEQSVRVEYVNGEPFFCLKDVATILEIRDTKSKNFNLSMKGVETFPLPTKGGIQNITFIDEPNLYRVIFRSNKPEAVKFQDWIFEEVIPAIRQTGGYTNPQPDTRINATQKQAIREAVLHRHHRTGEHWQEIYRKLHNLLRVNSYHEIQAADFQTALDFLASMENAPAKPQALQLDDEAVLNIGRLLLHASRAREFMRYYMPAFDRMGLDYKGQMYSFAYDSGGIFKSVQEFCDIYLPQVKEQAVVEALRERLQYR